MPLPTTIHLGRIRSKRWCLFLLIVSAISIFILWQEMDTSKTPKTLCLPHTHLDHSNNTVSLCKKDTHLDVIVMVNSGIRNFHKRKAIRATWGNESYYYSRGYKVRVFFTLGNPELVAYDLRQKVLRERDEFKDIVFINIEEAYQNNIYKTIYGLESIVIHCPKTDMVVKADDDIFVDVPRLYDTFMGDPSRSSSVWCTINTNSANRDPKAGWYVDPRVYGAHFPAYCFGSFYTMNITSLTVLMEINYCEPWFWIDDVFITGILRSKGKTPITNMDRQHGVLVGGYNLHEKKVNMEAAQDLKIVYHHSISPEAIRYLWSLAMLALQHASNQTTLH